MSFEVFKHLLLRFQFFCNMTLCCLLSASRRSNKRFAFNLKFWMTTNLASRSQWPRGLRRRSSAARLLMLWVRIPPVLWISVCCECCVLSGRGLCDGLITRPEESYWLWRVVVCDLETSWMKRPWPTGGCRVKPPPPKKHKPWEIQNEFEFYLKMSGNSCPATQNYISGHRKL